MKTTIITILSIVTFSGLFATEYDTIYIKDFGISANSRQNATLEVKEALTEAKSVKNPLLLFETGRYDFWPQYAEERDYYESNTNDINPKRLGILIENFDRLTLDGNGAEFIFHDRMQPLTVDHSANIEIRNFTVDWDIPLTAQAEIIEIDSISITLKINILESPYIIEDNRLYFVGEGWRSQIWGVMEVQKEERIIAPYTGDHPGWSAWGWERSFAREIRPGVVRIKQGFGPKRPATGNILILRHSVRDHAGIFLFHSKNILIRNADVYHTAGLGVLAQFSENISMDSVRMIPNPRKDRYLSSHDDGFHFSNCKGQIRITECDFAMLMDDPINIHGTSVRIIKKTEPNKLRCRFIHHQTVGLQWARAGEEIGYIENESMVTVASGVVKSFIPVDREVFEIEFEANVPEEIREGDALENLTWTADAYIANNRFMSCRARGILVSTPGKVVIEQNYFESSGSAILIAGDANEWYETGAVSDVIIRRNVFASPCLTSMYQFCEGIISIFPEIPDPGLSENKFHRNIRIEENVFHPFDYPILYAKSVDGLSFKGNELIRSYEFKPFHNRKYSFSFEFCHNVEISGNTFSSDILGRNVSLRGMNKRGIKIGEDQKLEITKLK